MAENEAVQRSVTSARWAWVKAAWRRAVTHRRPLRQFRPWLAAPRHIGRRGGSLLRLPAWSSPAGPSRRRCRRVDCWRCLALVISF